MLSFVIARSVSDEAISTEVKMNPYRWLWSRIGGRPWSFIIRDTWHKFEGLWIIGLVAVGALLGHWLWDLIFWFLLVFALGYIAGHLFWSTPWKEGEGK